MVATFLAAAGKSSWLSWRLAARELNGPPALLATAANTMAVVTFVVAGAVQWFPTLTMLLGGTVGSYTGARIGRSLSPRTVRALTLLFASGITAAFFIRAYWERI